MKQLLRNFYDKFKESAISVAPFFLIIIVLYLCFLPFNIFAFLSIILATLLMILGMALFNVGADMSTMKMGGYVGSNLSKSRKFSFMIILSFVLGFIVTIAEPDLMVLAEQVPGISSKWIILIAVSGGTGIFLLISTIKTIFRLNIKTLLIISYIIALILSIFANNNFLPLAYDSVGITTGAVSAPFIMAFGLGICAVRSGKNNQEDGFGLIAMASIGPVISVLIVSMFVRANTEIVSEAVTTVTTGGEMAFSFFENLLSYFKDVFIVILPIFLFFLYYNYRYLKLPKVALIRLFIGLLYTYFGLTIFLTGVTAGYLPTADILGYSIASGGTSWMLIPISLIIGFFLIFAEPAVHILNKQVEDITEGVITRKTMLIALSVGVSLAMLLIVVRAMLSIDFMYVIAPLTVIMVVLSIYSPKMFVSIAFDSGGVAAGSLSASFVLPFIVGICKSLEISAMLYAFGSVALIAILPTIVIQIMGIRYQLILNKAHKKVKLPSSVTIIDFE